MNQTTKTCAIIGAGISGIAAAIRMRNKGYEVTVFEANAFAGGKLSTESNKGYRFDMGPSVFTMPEYVDELFVLVVTALYVVVVPEVVNLLKCAVNNCSSSAFIFPAITMRVFLF